MAKYHSDNEIGNPLLPFHRLLFQIIRKGSFIVRTTAMEFSGIDPTTLHTMNKRSTTMMHLFILVDSDLDQVVISMVMRDTYLYIFFSLYIFDKYNKRRPFLIINQWRIQNNAYRRPPIIRGQRLPTFSVGTLGRFIVYVAKLWGGGGGGRAPHYTRHCKWMSYAVLYQYSALFSCSLNSFNIWF